MRSSLGLLLFVTACDVSARSVDGGAPCVAVPVGATLVVSSDYASSVVSAIGADGRVLDRALLASSSGSVGLSVALSGDVAVPSSAAGEDLVVLDRKAGNVIWLDPAGCGVTRQLRTGDFASNPQDYVEPRDGTAWVARLGEDPAVAPGGASIDRGGDVLVIDRATNAIRSSLDLRSFVPTTPPGAEPNPARFVPWNSRVLVLLGGFATADPSVLFDDAADATIVSLDPARDAIDGAASLTIAGKKNCAAGVALADGGLAIACTGLTQDVDPARLAQAGIAWIEPDFTIDLVVGVDAIGGQQPSLQTLAEVAPGALLLVTTGPTADDADALRLVRRAGDAVSAETIATAGGFTLGDVSCRAGRCWVADASANAVRRFDWDGERLTEGAPIALDPILPPRTLGPR